MSMEHANEATWNRPARPPRLATEKQLALIRSFGVTPKAGTAH